MEKILKLIKSPCRDDLEIGIRLLLSLPFEDIMSFFVNYNTKELQDPNVINIAVNKSFIKPSEHFYIEVNNEYYFLHYYNWIRLRKRRVLGVSPQIPVISLKEYLYGEDT